MRRVDAERIADDRLRFGRRRWEDDDDEEEEFWEGFWFLNRRRGRGESEERGETVEDIIERADDLPAPRRDGDD